MGDKTEMLAKRLQLLRDAAEAYRRHGKDVGLAEDIEYFEQKRRVCGKRGSEA